MISLDVNVERDIQIVLLPAHIKFFRSIIKDLVGSPLPFDSDYFVPTIYDISVRAADLHVLLGTNDQNILIPVASEQAPDDFVEIIERHRRETLLESNDAQPSEVIELGDGTVIRVDSIGQPLNSYLDFNAKEFEMSFGYASLEHDAKKVEKHISIDVASVDAQVLLSRCHSAFLKNPKIVEQLRATFRNPSILVSMSNHTELSDDTLIDWYAYFVLLLMLLSNSRDFSARRSPSMPQKSHFLGMGYSCAMRSTFTQTSLVIFQAWSSPATQRSYHRRI